MTKYYELDEDLYFPGRWVLDDPVGADHCDGREFRYGNPIIINCPLRAPIHTPGKALDFSYSLSDVPILSERIANAIRDLVGGRAQLFPVDVDELSHFEILNATAVIECFDESRSEFTKWRESDGRPDRIGQYRMVTKLCLDPSKIPPDLHVFRVKGWKIALIVSQAFVDAILPLNPTGVKLKLVT